MQRDAPWEGRPLLLLSQDADLAVAPDIAGTCSIFNPIIDRKKICKRPGEINPSALPGSPSARKPRAQALDTREGSSSSRSTNSGAGPSFRR